jgi:hypothetical protein
MSKRALFNLGGQICIFFCVVGVVTIGWFFRHAWVGNSSEGSQKGRVRGSSSCLIDLMAGIMGKVSIVSERHHDQKQVMEGRVYLAYTFTSLLITEGIQNRSLSMAGMWNYKPNKPGCTS